MRKTASAGVQEYNIRIVSLNKLILVALVYDHRKALLWSGRLRQSPPWWFGSLLFHPLLSPPFSCFCKHSRNLVVTLPGLLQRFYLFATASLESHQASPTTHAGWWFASSSLHDPAFFVLSLNFTRIRQTIAPCRQYLVSPEESTDGSTVSRMKVAIHATPLSRGAALLARMSHTATPFA